MWLKDLKSNANPDVKIFLIGNKSDLEDERTVKKEVAEQFKKDYDLDLFMETSAKTGLNTQELFAEAGKLLYKEHSKYKKNTRPHGEQLKNNEGNNKENKQKQCC